MNFDRLDEVVTLTIKITITLKAALQDSDNKALDFKW